jgi:O-antigen ligase
MPESRPRRQTAVGASPSGLRVHRFDALLLRIVDGGLAGCIFVVPLLMGGRHALGQFVLVALATTVAVAWTVRQCRRAEATWRLTTAVLIPAAAVVLVIGQLVPLSRAWLGRLASHTVAILPLWSPEADPATRLGLWRQISLTPAVTQDALVLLLAYTVVFLVTLQRIRAVEDVRRLLRWCALSAVLMAGFGLVQYLFGNGKFFWCYQHPYSSASDVCKGSFANRNHFAHFLALGIGPLIWWIHDAFRRRRARSADRFGPSTKPPLDNPLLNNPLFDGELKIALLVLALAVVLFAGLLSLSRGGVVVMVLAGTISAVVCCRAASLRGRFIAGLAAAGVLIIASLAVFGHERVSTRMSDLSSGSLETLDRFQGRRTIWTAVAKAIPDFALLGSGVGSHREVYPMYLKVMDHPLEYTHAENGYMQVLLETGAAGLVLLLVGIGFCAFWCIAGLRMANRDGAFACVGAVAAGLAASAMHSAVDFVWYVPACTVMIAVLAACACRLWQTGGDGACWQTGGDRAWRIVTPRTINVAAAVAIAVVGVWMVHGRIGPMRAQPYWDEYGITAGALSAQPAPAAIDDPEKRAEAAAAELAAEKRTVACLEEVVRLQPRHARAHIQLAKSYLRLFDLLQIEAPNPMSLRDIRDAAIKSQAGFPSRKARDAWMRRAFGEHCEHLNRALYHTRRGLALCPLQGKGYLYLAELCFLDGLPASSKPGACGAAFRRLRPLRRRERGLVGRRSEVVARLLEAVVP